ncbi:hypothetical protein [Leucobacter chinensis]|uniref:hypothetical protein n=1 Tax=Leucobacter chinensis TaxID=2851010 RepID=UPI001C24FFB8|nr:hypothetical protein [Leucobacter chinensis]
MSFITAFLTNVSFYRRALTETKREARATRTRRESPPIAPAPREPVTREPVTLEPLAREPAAPEQARPQPLSPGESMVFWGAWRGLGMPLLLTQLPPETAEPRDES